MTTKSKSKNVKLVVDSEWGDEYFQTVLTSTRVQQTFGKNYKRWVLLKDLNKFIPERGQSTFDHSSDNNLIFLHHKYSGKLAYTTATWLELSYDGRLSIGCQLFTLASSKKILKAAGIKLKAGV